MNRPILMNKNLEQARELWAFLAKRGWVKQKDIPIPGPTVRQICNDYAPYFISNTARGYHLTKSAPEDDVRHSINDLRSRAKKMLQRADKLERYLFNGRQGQLGNTY